MPPDPVRSHSLVCPSGALAQVSSLVRGHVAGTLDQGLHLGLLTPKSGVLYSHHLPLLFLELFSNTEACLLHCCD